MLQATNATRLLRGKNKAMTGLNRLDQKLAGIAQMSRPELIELWIKAHGYPPPKGVKRPLLERSAAWQMQASRLGGHSREVRQHIRQGVAALVGTRQCASPTIDALGECMEAIGSIEALDTSASDTSQLSRRGTGLPPALTPGSRLMREWNGRMHVVDVTETEFVFDGKAYRSLSAIARRITGTNWSGPRFFGVGRQ